MLTKLFSPTIEFFNFVKLFQVFNKDVIENKLFFKHFEIIGIHLFCFFCKYKIVANHLNCITIHLLHF